MAVSSLSFIIVGAGAFGVSTALHLVRRRGRGDSRIGPVLLLDSQPFPSVDAASNDTSRAVRMDYANEFNAKLGYQAVVAWQNDPTFRPHYHHVGRLGAARPGQCSHNMKCREEICKLGVEIEVLSDGSGPGNLKSRFPALDGPVTGYDLYFNPEAGWAHPHNALKSAMEEYKCLGGNIIDHQTAGKVVKNIINGGVLRGVETAAGTRHFADRILFATGAYSHAELLPGLNTQIHPIGFAIAHWRVDEGEKRLWENHPVVDLYHHGYFFPPDREGLMKMGTGVMGFGSGSAQVKNEQGDVLSGLSVPLRNSDLAGTVDEGVIPREAEQAIRWILAQMAPKLASKPFFDMKICWDGMVRG